MTARIYLDTNIFIYAFEGAGPFSGYARAILDLIRQDKATAVISDLVVAELLVRPLADGDDQLIDAYSSLFNSPRGYEACAIDRDILLEASRYRAQNGKTRLPDAIHIATACRKNRAAFVSHDRRLNLPDGLIGESLSATTVSNILALA